MPRGKKAEGTTTRTRKPGVFVPMNAEVKNAFAALTILAGGDAEKLAKEALAGYATDHGLNEVEALAPLFN